MAEHIIDINPLDHESVRAAQREIDRIYREFDRKVNTFLEELAKIGRNAAQGAYGNGGAVVVTANPIDNGFEIRADGDAVVFLEFGAGDTVNTGNRYAQQMPFEVRSGSYSEMNHGEYAQTKAATGQGYWHFGGVRYTEVQPRNGMQQAYEEIMRNIRATAQRVFA